MPTAVERQIGVAMAEVSVQGFTVVRDVFGADIIEMTVSEPATVGRMIDELLERFGKPLRDLLWDGEAGALTPFLLRVNDEIVSSTLDKERTINDGDKIAIIFPIGGG